MRREYKVGDLIIANFPWGQHELWNEKYGYMSDAIKKGDSLLVLSVTEKRVKVLAQEGITGWISKTILEQE